MSRLSLRAILATALVAAACLGVSAIAAEYIGPVERLVATAVDLTDGSASAGRIDLVIERWSSDEERQHLYRPILASNPNQLLAAIQEVRHRVGFIQSPGLQGAGARARLRRAQNIYFAREISTPAGRRVIVATDRHLGFGEAPPAVANADGSHAWSYAQPPAEEFTLIDIRLGADGKGIGKFVPATQVAYDKGTGAIEVENYAGLPVRLMNVTSERVVTKGSEGSR
jgi:hypothetical protein